jgi:hypothetical protein
MRVPTRFEMAYGCEHHISRTPRVSRHVLLSMNALSFLALFLLFQPAGVSAGVPVQMVVTAEGQKGTQPPELGKGDVQLHHDKNQLRVEDLVPLRGDRAGLQLAIMIDDGSNTNLGVQFGDIKSFIREQPASTQIGLYYIRNGTAAPAQNMTADHEAVASHLRLPIGQPGVAASPSTAISDFIKQWPATADRREILLISDGIDLDRSFPPENPYLTTAIADAQRAGVLVNSIYFAGAGHSGHDFFLSNRGRDYLSYLGDQTGGEAYWEGLATSVSLQPYLSDLSTRLRNQYLLVVGADPVAKGRFERVRLHTEVPHVEIMSAEQVWIPASK